MVSEHKPFSIWRFSAAIGLQFVLLLIATRLAAPALWHRQVSAGAGALVLAFLGFEVFLCFFEWAFHRYVLHAVVAPNPILKRFARGHRHHHALTNIQLQSPDAGPGRIVLNRYPITETDQMEDAAFPVYSLVGFWAFFTPLLIVVQFVLPQAPIYLAGYAAITWSLFSYEVVHWLAHLPYEWWERATEHPRFGGLWRRIYGFHHFHHANIRSNEALSGFFGLPLADWAFGTYHLPPELLLHGRVATAKMFAVRPPRPFVAWLDRWARKQEAVRSSEPERHD